jgi:hypothetical protein
MSPLKSSSVFIIALFAAACSSDGYTPYLDRFSTYKPQTDDLERFSLQRTACFGFCPIYQVSVDERDVLSFRGERFVAEDDGVLSKKLPNGSFKKLVRIAQDHRFSGFDQRYPNEAGDNCGPVATDMPSVIVSYDTKRLDHSVSWYQGCMNFDGRERFEAMVAEIDAILDIDPWIGPRESFYSDQSDQSPDDVIEE